MCCMLVLPHPVSATRDAPDQEEHWGRSAGEANFPAIWHQWVGQHLVQVPLPTDVQSVHSTDDVLWVDRWGVSVSKALTAISSHLCLQECLITPHKMQGSAHQEKFLRTLWVDSRWSVPPGIKEKLLFGPQAPKRKPVGWRQCMSLQNSAGSFTWTVKGRVLRWSHDLPPLVLFWLPYVTWQRRSCRCN